MVNQKPENRTKDLAILHGRRSATHGVADDLFIIGSRMGQYSLEDDLLAASLVFCITVEDVIVSKCERVELCLVSRGTALGTRQNGFNKAARKILPFLQSSTCPLSTTDYTLCLTVYSIMYLARINPFLRISENEILLHPIGFQTIVVGVNVRILAYLR